jgi:hypothetical protein
VASLLLDEDVSEKNLDPLQARGHISTSIGKLGRKGINDALQLLFAAQPNYIFVTHNAKHYILLHEAWTASARAWNATPIARHAGIIVIYTSRGLTPTDIADAIDRLISTRASIENRLHTWSLADGWQQVG